MLASEASSLTESGRWVTKGASFSWDLANVSGKFLPQKRITWGSFLLLKFIDALKTAHGFIFQISY